MAEDFWLSVQGRNVSAPPPRGFMARLPQADGAAEISSDERPKASTVLSGFTCIIEYTDAKGDFSRRRVTFIRLEEASDERYLRTYCHERERTRQFKVDRITAAADIDTGEIFDLPDLLNSLSADHSQSSKPGWGLCPRDRADLIAGINVMVFVARCDREWHPLESDAIEHFITSCWLRCGFEAELPLDDLLAHARKLRPDAESFYGSLIRATERPELQAIIRRNVAQVIDADGKISPEELYWGSQVDEFFQEN